MWPGFDSRSWRHTWVKFVVGSCPCSERFFSGYSGFPLSTKTNISKFQFDLDYCSALYHEPLAREVAQAFPVLLALKKLLCFILPMTNEGICTLLFSGSSVLYWESFCVVGDHTFSPCVLWFFSILFIKEKKKGTRFVRRCVQITSSEEIALLDCLL